MDEAERDYALMAEFTHNGIRYRELPNGQAEVIGPVATVGGTFIPPSARTERRKDADADRAQAEAIRAQAEAGVAPQRAAADVARARADVSKAPSEIAKTSAEATIAARKAQDISGGIAYTDEQRGALLNQYRTLGTLASGVNELRSSYATNLKGKNPLEGMLGKLRPQDKVFDDASGGLSAFVAAALGLSGQQFNTPAEQQLFIGSILPKAADTDEQIENKLRRLDELIGRAKGQGRQILGITSDRDPLAGDPAINALDARLGGPTAGGPTSGVTSRGGFTQVPSLAGIGQEVANMIEGGASSQQVKDYLAQRYADTSTEHGGRLNLSAEQQAFFDDAIARRRANPDRPLSDFITGFERLGGYEAPDEGWSLGGAIAESPLGAGIMSAGNAVTFGNLANLAGDDAGAVLGASRDENPLAAFTGDMVGSGLAMGGLGGAAAKAGVPYLTAALTRGGGVGADMLYGGARGASETEGGVGDKVRGGLFGLAAAGGGNVLGRGIVSGAGRATRGVSDEAVRLLNERGISMTPGQILGQNGFIGRRLGSLENAIESVPFIGGNFRDRRMQGVGEYGRAQLEENLGSIGFDAAGDQFDGDMLGRAQQAVGDAYGFLDGRTFQSDPQFVDELAAALTAGRSVPRVGDEFGAIIDRQVAPNFPPDGAVTGRGFQDTLQTLRGARSGFSQDGAMGSMAGDAISDIEAALMGMVERQAPDAIEGLGRANQAYAGLVPIENASITATNAAGGANQFTPAQYGRAAVNNTRRFGGRAAAARGDIPGGDLQRAAQQVLPSDVPNSGTADRGMAAMLLPAALGGGAVAAQGMTDDPLLTALLLGLGGASTQTGQRAIQRALLDRPEALRNAGEYVYQLRDLGGRGGGVLGASSIPWLLANE